MTDCANDSSRISILISGRGSNMESIHRCCGDGSLDATVVNVIANNADAAGLAYAEKHGIATTVVDHRLFDTRASFEQALATKINGYNPSIVALAGFMRVLSASFVDQYQGRLLNIHPSLLPRHPGLDTHNKVLACGDRWHGCSVHFVSPSLDQGPLIARSAIPVLPGDTAESLSQRVLQKEHALYPRVLAMCLRDELCWKDGALLYRGSPLRYPLNL